LLLRRFRPSANARQRGVSRRYVRQTKVARASSSTARAAPFKRFPQPTAASSFVEEIFSSVARIELRV